MKDLRREAIALKEVVADLPWRTALWFNKRAGYGGRETFRLPVGLVHIGGDSPHSASSLRVNLTSPRKRGEVTQVQEPSNLNDTLSLAR